MATDERIVLDRTKAFFYDESDLTNVLTSSGFHLVSPNVLRILEDYDSTAVTGYTMEVVTDADEILALKFLEDAGGYCVFPVYSGTETETFEGYLVIYDADTKVCSLDGGINIGVSETAATDFVAAIIAYLSDDVKAAEFIAADDPEVLTDAVTAAAAKVRFVEE